MSDTLSGDSYPDFDWSEIDTIIPTDEGDPEVIEDLEGDADFAPLDPLHPPPPKPREYKRVDTTKMVCVTDTETDPFQYDEEGNPFIVKPFSIGFRTPNEYYQFWGDDCVEQFFRFLEEHYEPGTLIIYAHNGGRFDFMFFLEWMNTGQSPFMIDGRIVRAFFGGQEFRDSYKIMPFPLEEYRKTPIDYSKFTRDKREGNKREIQAYQKDDCDDLYDLVYHFHKRFGDRLTIASTSLPILNSYHGFELMSDISDQQFRKFYFGGRVQCFKSGLIYTPGKVVDVNSMYPHVMAKYRHPIGSRPKLATEVGPNTMLVCLNAENLGALCYKAEDHSLDFTLKKGDFYCTIHEYWAGVETGTLVPRMIKHCWDWEPEFCTTFEEFVMATYGERQTAKETGDKITAIFLKYLLNSSYGKFAQDPRDYEEFQITLGEVPDNDLWTEENQAGWYPHSENEAGYHIYARASKTRWRSFKNVATAASITGAARAELLKGIRKATGVIYCDTDSLMCSDFKGEMHPSELGKWAIEAEYHLAAIAGKKLYALFSPEPPEKPVDKDDDGVIDDPRLGRLYCIKKASKGAHLTAYQIYRIAQGDTVEYVNPVPQFKIDGIIGPPIRRNIKRTS